MNRFIAAPQTSACLTSQKPSFLKRTTSLVVHLERLEKRYTFGDSHVDVLRGVDSIAIHYKGITGTHVVEVLFFDKDGAVRESYVHYASPE